MKFLVVVEKARKGYSAYSPDLPGCIATGRNRSLAERAMRKALVFHLEGLKAEGQKVPPPRSTSMHIEVPG